MPEVTLCVSPLVKRVFESRYGSCVAKIERRDIVYRYLQGDPLIANQHRYRALQKLLPETVTLNVSEMVASRLRAKKRNLYVGYFLHKIYQDQILVFVDAQVKAGVEAQTAMKAWLKENGVQEDDYGLDSAYTSWKRKKTFLKNIKKKEFNSCTEIDLLNVNEFELNKTPYDARDIVVSCNTHFKIGFCHLLRRNLKTKKGFVYQYSEDKTRTNIYPRKILCYLLMEYCWMSSSDISKLVNVSVSLICRYVRHIRFDITQYPEVKADIDQVLAATPHLSRTNQTTSQPLLS